jgi:hypothetical protein
MGSSHRLHVGIDANVAIPPFSSEKAAAKIYFMRSRGVVRSEVELLMERCQAPLRKVFLVHCYFINAVLRVCRQDVH